MAAGILRWKVLSSDISNSEENRNNLIFCDFRPATWYQLKVSATNDAGKMTATYNIATTKVNGGKFYFTDTIEMVQTNSKKRKFAVRISTHSHLLYMARI